MQNFDFKLVWPRSSFILHLLNHSFSWLINKYMLRAALSAIEDIVSDGQPPFNGRIINVIHTTRPYISTDIAIDSNSGER